MPSPRLTKVCDLEVARSGLHEKELAGLGIDYATARIESRTHAGYYPGVGPITVDPASQNQTVGRRLMSAVLDRASERNVAGGETAANPPFTIAPCVFTQSRASRPARPYRK